MLLKWFFGSDVSNTRSESRASLAAAPMALCMLSAPFSRGFPEKGMAWCGVHYSCAKAFMCAPAAPLWQALAGLGRLRHPCLDGDGCRNLPSHGGTGVLSLGQVLASQPRQGGLCLP